MDLKVFGKGFNYSQDGPGNRLVYHLAGCNMSCPWCSNPDGMSGKGENVKNYSQKEILNEILISTPMFFDGGGVTFTGGEATLQAEALIPLLKELKSKGIHTAIETNGTSKKFRELLQYIDFLIIDYKHPDGEKLKAITGAYIGVIEENILFAAQSGTNMLIRIPLIGGFNAGQNDIDGFIDFFSAIKGECVKFEVLKYHEYGKDKWINLGLEYKMENAFVDDSLKAYFEERIKNIGHTVTTT